MATNCFPRMSFLVQAYDLEMATNFFPYVPVLFLIFLLQWDGGCWCDHNWTRPHRLASIRISRRAVCCSIAGKGNPRVSNIIDFKLCKASSCHPNISQSCLLLFANKGTATALQHFCLKAWKDLIAVLLNKSPCRAFCFSFARIGNLTFPFQRLWL